MTPIADNWDPVAPFPDPQRRVDHGPMPKKIVISTHVPPETAARISNAVAATGTSRYAWIAQAVAEKLERESNGIA